MSVNEKMTALANEVRRLSNTEGKLGIDGMTEKLARIELDYNPQFVKSLIEGTITELISEDLEDVTTLRPYAFRKCTSLRSIKISDTAIKSIPDYAFMDLPNLEDLELPKELVTVGYDALGTGTANYALTKLVIPKTVTATGFECFNSFKALKTIEFEEGSKFVQLGNYSISGMESLTHIKFLNALTWCNYSFCNNCPSLQYLDFTSVNKISALNSTSGVFGGTTPTTAKVIVPASLYDTWVSHTNWSNFADRIVPDTMEGTSWVFDTSKDIPSDLVPFTQDIYGTHGGQEFDRITWDGNNLTFTYNPDTESETNMWCYEYGWQCGEEPIWFESLNGETTSGAFISFMYHVATKQEG